MFGGSPSRRLKMPTSTDTVTDVVGSFPVALDPSLDQNVWSAFTMANFIPAVPVNREPLFRSSPW
jgi:hypothetical protein